MRRNYLKASAVGGILAVASAYATAAAAGSHGNPHGNLHGNLHGARLVTTAVRDTVTGCLQKGSRANEFTLVAKNGKTYEVTSKHVALAGHVGHTVRLTGMTAAEHGGKMMDDNDGRSTAMKDSGAMGGAGAMHDTTKMGGMEKAGGMGKDKRSTAMKDSGAMGGAGAMHDTRKMGGMGMEAGTIEVTKLTMMSPTCQ